jgi:hypothetical protein
VDNKRISCIDSMTTLAEVEKAKSAVLDFWPSVDLSVGKPHGFRCNREAILRVAGLTDALTEAPNTRRSAMGTPLDFYAPSAWHAACSLLTLDVQSRLRRHTVDTPLRALETDFGKRVVYRGQSRPWSIVPTNWRSNRSPPSTADALAPMLAYLQTLMSDEDAIELGFIGRLRSIEDCTALAQHYGFPTTLVDFTFDPMVALRFACGPCDAPPPKGTHPDLAECAVVYFTSFHKLYDLSNVRLSFPPIQAERLFRQSGLFVDYGPKTSTLDNDDPSETPLSQNLQRLYFQRTFPIDGSGFALPAADLLQPEPFLEDLVTQVRALAGDWRDLDLDEQVALLRSRITTAPPWRVANELPFIYFKDEFDNVVRAVERYIRIAALIDLAGTPFLDPLVISSMARTDARGIETIEGFSRDPEFVGETAPIGQLLRQVRQLANYLERHLTIVEPDERAMDCSLRSLLFDSLAG